MLLSKLKTIFDRVSIAHLFDTFYFVWLGRFLYEFFLFINKPITDLINYVPDDTFYYLKIVQNAHQLNFISFDGINTTSGFHYLHFAILYLFNFLHFSKQGFVLVAVSISTIAFIAGMTLLWRSLRKEAYYFAIGTLFLGALLSDFERVVFMGLEVGLAVFAFALLFRIFLTSLAAIEQKQYQKIPRFIIVTVICLVCSFSRSDLLVVMGIVSVAYWWVARKEKNVFPYLFAMGTGIAFIVQTSVTFLLSHHLVQDSGAVKSALRSLWDVQGIPTWSLSVFSDLHMVFLNAFSFIDGLKLVKISSYSLIFLLLAFGLFFILVFWRLSVDRFQRIQAMVLLLSFFALGSVYQWIFAQVQVWYFLMPSVILLLAIGFCIDVLLKSYERHLISKVLIILLLIIGSTFSLQHLFPRGPMYGWQVDMYHKAFELKSMYGKGVYGRIGVWNGGIISYFSDLPIINLDGLVNTSVREIIELKRPNLMVNELHRQKIMFLADWEGVFHQPLTLFLFGIDFIDKQLVRVDDKQESVPFAIYRIRD